MLKRTFILLLGLALLLSFSVNPAVQAEEVDSQIPYGGWMDNVVTIEESSSAAGISQLSTGHLDVFADTITQPDLYERIRDDEAIQYSESFGSYNELSFNPAGPVFPETGELNPFAVPRVREAMNWLIDRDYLAEEIFGGMALPRLFPITSAFPDYARMIEQVRELEVKYAHDFERAERIISEEMIELGAEMVDGVWYFEGNPVVIRVLIRTEDERVEVGDYVADLLERIGFMTRRRYATAAEASPIWMSGNPEAGEFHVYTGGWVTTVVDRDQAPNWDFFYTPRGLGTPLWQAYQPSDEFDEVSRRLDTRDFSTMAEREELMARAMELGMEDSVRLWLVDRLAVNPYRSDVELTADLAGGISGSWLWAYTARKTDEIGGELRVGLPSVMTEPWNPLDGSNWVFDMMMIRATADMGYQWDPYTGLHYPKKFESAHVSIEEGLPVDKTLDWVELEFVEGGNQVPGDAWADWDPVEQRFLTVDEKYPEGITSRRKITTVYPEDFLEKTYWHDGSKFSAGDIVWWFLNYYSFDRSAEESEFFDGAKVAEYESFMDHFRGFKITSQDPLTIEYYSDLYYLDAEWYIFSGYPYYDQGPGAWHNMALGYLAEVEEETAFSSFKADQLDVERLNMIGGPSLDILEKHLDRALEENILPYSEVMSEFVTEEEVQERYQNLQAWYENKGHFWLGTGPYYVESVSPVAGILNLARNENYPYRADRWDIFVEPRVPEVDLTGPGAIMLGDEVVFELDISFDNEPYASDDLDSVLLLLFDENDNLVTSQRAVWQEAGNWQVIIDGDVTSELLTGSTTVEAVVTSKLVATPVIESMSVITF